MESLLLLPDRGALRRIPIPKGTRVIKVTVSTPYTLNISIADTMTVPKKAARARPRRNTKVITGIKVDVHTRSPEKMPHAMNDPAMKNILRNGRESRNAEIKILPMMSPKEMEMMAKETSSTVRPMSFMKLAKFKARNPHERLPMAMPANHSQGSQWQYNGGTSKFRETA